MKKLIFFGLLMAIILSAAIAEEDGWIKNPANNHYYRLTDHMTWAEAEAQAVEWGGHLVTLNNWEEESWIKTTFDENEYFWIGFNDIAEEGTWVWSSGEPVVYTNWDEGEPNDCGGWGPGCEPEDAAVMNWAVCSIPEPGKNCYGDKWNDLHVDGWYIGIVERNFLTCEEVSPVSPPENLALNPSRSGFPHPLESSRGWGMGWDKWDIVDGVRKEPPDPDYGLAFTGGKRPWIEPCGWRQATINFGEEKTFNKVVVWHHALKQVPNTYKIQYWDGLNWIDIFSTTNGHDYLKYTYPIEPPRCWWHSSSTPTENTFSPVTSSKVRFKLYNCDIIHGWIYNFEVYYDLELQVDIKPQSCPNPLNVKSKGVFPVAVLGTEDFDVFAIDPMTIRLTREGYEGVVPIRWSYEDVATPFEGEECDCHDLDGDGYLDLTLKFDTQELVGTLKLGEVAGQTIPLILTCNLTEEAGGTPIKGSDCIKVQKSGKK